MSGLTINVLSTWHYLIAVSSIDWYLLIGAGREIETFIWQCFSQSALNVDPVDPIAIVRQILLGGRNAEGHSDRDLWVSLIPISHWLGPFGPWLL